MKFGAYGFLIIFGAFVLLLIINPNLSCFGKKLKSPFYPLLRRKREARDRELLKQERFKQLKTEDYGFKLTDEEDKARTGGGHPQAKDEPRSVLRDSQEKAQDYGFKLH